ncbi:MAG: hypothetical protein JWR47_3107 [Phenylobacterium sp.]|jgi:hypothetical protein|nr:hypothetical protein [Phenylobacterium sp.]MDB5436850.1 hypothetical protein [Phenylobacterium sp.]
MARKLFRTKRRAKPPWTRVEVSVGPAVHHGRYRMEGDEVVLEWREGRVSERCGLVRPDVIATCRLRQLVSDLSSEG